MSDSRAYITRNSVYVVSGGRWAKTTGLRVGERGPLLGGWEALYVFRRGTASEGWVDCEGVGVRVGDCLYFSSRNYWGATTPVLDIITCHNRRRATLSGLDDDDTQLVLARDAAFLVSHEACERLLPNGEREAASRADVLEHLPSATVLTVRA